VSDVFLARALAAERAGNLEQAETILAGEIRPGRVDVDSTPPVRRPASGWAALTPTEVKIVHLVAEGQSNPDTQHASAG
jgi:hypothetical protein